MTDFVLVVCRNSNIRRFCVDNLVARGYLAVGIASLDEGKALLEYVAPKFVLMCNEPEEAESDLARLRQRAGLSAVPVVLVSIDRPGREWLRQWKVAAHFPYPIDARQFVHTLHPWLAQEPQKRAILLG